MLVKIKDFEDFGVVPTVDSFSHCMVYHDAYPQINLLAVYYRRLYP
jgi:hypothetical protein